MEYILIITVAFGIILTLIITGAVKSVVREELIEFKELMIKELTTKKANEIEKNIES